MNDAIFKKTLAEALADTPGFKLTAGVEIIAGGARGTVAVNGAGTFDAGDASNAAGNAAGNAAADWCATGTGFVLGLCAIARICRDCLIRLGFRGSSRAVA
jgi:hypothetical protein